MKIIKEKILKPELIDSKSNLLKMSKFDKCLTSLHIVSNYMYENKNNDSNFMNFESIESNLKQLITLLPKLSTILKKNKNNDSNGGILLIEYKSDLELTFQDLKKKHFSPEIINKLPLKVPTKMDEEGLALAFVIHRFSDNSIILTLINNHAFIDGTSRCIILRLLSDIALDKPYKLPIFLEDSLDKFIPKAKSPFDSCNLNKPKSNPMENQDNNSYKCLAIAFDNQRLKTLKQNVNSLSKDKNQWISTNDALNALIWKSLTTSRLECNLISNDEIFYFIFTKNIREICEFSPNSIGNGIIEPTLPMKVSDILKENLFDLAYKIRTSITELSTDKISEMFNQILNLSNIGYLEKTLGNKDFLTKSICFSQWSKFSILKNLDLGIW